MPDTRTIISRILDVISDCQNSPDLSVELRGGKLTLVADLGVHAAPVKRTAVVPTGAADVTPEAILAVLERRKAGCNLANLAKLVGVAKKMAVKPLVERMIAEGRIERATGGKFRLPGRVKRGRKPGSGRRATVNKPIRPVVAPKPAPFTPKKQPAIKPKKKAARPSQPVVKAASPIKKPVPASRAATKPRKMPLARPVTKKTAPARVASTPESRDESPAPVAEPGVPEASSHEEQPA